MFSVFGLPGNAMRSEHFSAPSGRRSIAGIGLIALDVLERDGNVENAKRAGGTCANVLTILSYLGWQSYPIGRLNGDKAAKSIRRDLSSFRVHLEYTSTGPASRTPIIRHLLPVQGKGDHRFSLRCPNCRSWLPTYQPVRGQAIDDLLPFHVAPEVVFVDRASPAALRLAEAGRSSGALIVFEPSGRATDRAMVSMLRVAHVLKYSHESMRQLDLPEHKAPLEIQTMGAKGLRFRMVRDNRRSVWQVLPPTAVPVVRDSAGSGDWCTAGFLHALLAHRPVGNPAEAIHQVDAVREALEFGQAVAALNCSYEGARGAMYVVDRAELSSHVRKLKQTEQATSRSGMKRGTSNRQRAISAFQSLCLRCAEA